MKIISSEFVISNTNIKKCPNPDMPEYAFIGRSNVGKSSLINMLCQKKDLAKTSATPGKTRLINHFLINNNWYIADLPGYGYAKISKSLAKTWGDFTEEYMLKRSNLMCVFLLIDVRHQPLKIDLDFMEFLATNGVPFVIVFTKADKLGKTEVQKNVAAYKRSLKEFWEELPQMFLTSSSTKQGREEILDFIEQTNQLFENSGL